MFARYFSKRLPLVLLFSSSLYFGLNSCGSGSKNHDDTAQNQPDPKDNPTPPPPSSVPPSEGSQTPVVVPPSFATVDNDILQKKCTPCHAKGAQTLPALVGNEKLFLQLRDQVVTRIQSKDPSVQMPPVPKPNVVSAAEKHTLLVYFGKEAPAPGEQPVDYLTKVFPKLARHCSPCHTQTNTMGLPGFVGNQALVDLLGDKISERITSTDSALQMPPPAPPAEGLSPEETDTIVAYYKSQP